MKKILGLIIVSLLLMGNAYAQSVTFGFSKSGIQAGSTFYKIKVHNRSQNIQAILTAFNYENSFYQEGDTIRLAEWIGLSDTAVFKLQQIRSGISCWRCGPKAIVVLPGDEKDYVIEVPGKMHNQFFEASVFKMTDYCYKSFIEETKGNDWFRKYQIDTLRAVIP